MSPCILCSQGTTPKRYDVAFRDGAPALNDAVLCTSCVAFLKSQGRRVAYRAGA